MRGWLPRPALLLLLVSLAPAGALEFRVAAALPVRGRPLRVSVASLAGDVRVAARQGDRDVWSTKLHPAANGRAEAAWTPDLLGPVTLTASDATTTLTRAVTVVPWPLHFNWWSCGPEQRVVTSKLLGKGEDPRRWLDRGVLPLAWKWGGGHPTWTEAAQWTDHWTTELHDTPGIMIDEFGGGGAKDEVMGRALQATRQKTPGLFLAPYCVGLAGSAMTAGFRDADVVLVETYVYDWRGYHTFDQRLAGTAPVADRAIAVLGLHDWATTPGELRRQIGYLRTTRPDMPGLGLFHDAPPRLLAALDTLLSEQFLQPALLLTVADGRATVRNVGCLPAPAVALRLGTVAAPLGTLAPGASAQAAVPAGSTAVLAPGGYTVLDYRDPTTLPPPDATATEQARAWRRGLLAGPTVAATEPLQLTRQADGEAVAKDQVTGADVPLASPPAGPVGLSCRLALDRAYFYGHCGVGLEGAGRMGFEWDHGDHDRDVPADHPRLVFRYVSPAGETVRETCPPALAKGHLFELVCGQREAGVVRAQLWEADGALLWDTGDLPCDGLVKPTKLRLTVKPWRGSNITAADGVFHLRGVSGGPEPSPYVLESSVSAVRLLTATQP